MSVQAEASTEQVSPATTPARDTFTLQYLFFCITIVAVVLASWRMGPEFLAALYPLLVVAWLVERAIFDGPRRTWFGSLLPFGLPVFIVSLPSLLPTIGACHNYYQLNAQNKLQTIEIALETRRFESKQAVPMVITDLDGLPMHSWRALILSEAGLFPLASIYRWDERWDGPTNCQLFDQSLREFRLSRSSAGHSTTDAGFLAVDVPCGYLDDRFIVVEVPNSGIEVFEPRDITLTELGRPGFRGGQKNGTHTHVLWLDGSVELVPVDKLVPRILNYMDEQRAEAAQRAKRP